VIQVSGEVVELMAEVSGNRVETTDKQVKAVSEHLFSGPLAAL